MPTRQFPLRSQPTRRQFRYISVWGSARPLNLCAPHCCRRRDDDRLSLVLTIGSPEAPRTAHRSSFPATGLARITWRQTRLWRLMKTSYVLRSRAKTNYSSSKSSSWRSSWTACYDLAYQRVDATRLMSVRQSFHEWSQTVTDFNAFCND